MPKPAPAREMIEGPEAWKRFSEAVKQIVSVPKDELARRDAAWHKARAKVKRGKRS